MTLRTLMIATLVSVPMIGSASAEEAITLTPPLYREQARATAALPPASELATTPRPVPTAPASSRVVTATAMPTR